MIFVNQNIREYGVIELSQEIKKSLEENFGYIRLRGEVSGLSVSKAGHVFLSLKEQNDLIEAIIWPDKFQKIKHQATRWNGSNCIWKNNDILKR